MEERMSRSDWVRAGLSALSETGVEGVRVEKLAQQIGITKGSFYWHFKDRDDLLVSIIEEWERVQTSAVIEAVEATDDTPLLKLRNLSLLVAGFDVNLEAAMRRWAASDSRARLSIERIDRSRLEHIQSIIARAGVPEGEAKLRARLVYFAFIGEVAFGMSTKLSDRPTSTEAIQAMILRWP
jgi:AcrR family transcriptional regulator